MGNILKLLERFVVIRVHFQTETMKFIRFIQTLKFHKNECLPAQGPPLEKSIAAACIHRKAGYGLFE